MGNGPDVDDDKNVDDIGGCSGGGGLSTVVSHLDLNRK